MTVGELLDLLQNCPREAVIVQRDSRERYGYYYDTSHAEVRTQAAADEGDADEYTVILFTGDIATDVPKMEQE